MDIKAEILDYINCNETTGALLLTGPWGCGKSFLVKQIIKDLNKTKKYAIAIISLFGIDNISSLNHRIREEYLSVNKPFVSKAKKFIKPLGNITKDGFDVASIANPSLVGLSAASQGLSAILSYDFLDDFKVKNTVGKNIQFALVFDDLERSNITPKDLLGVMNEYVENRKIKVIVIADEAKIKGEEYKEYKEKLISRTLCMAADYEALIGNIVANYSETSTGYRDFMVQNQDLLKQVFFESKTFNIRTLKSILADFERVYTAWEKSGVPTDKMKWALYTFGAEVFVSKSPKSDDNDSKKQNSSFFFDKKEEQYPDKGKCQSSFNSIGCWIKQGIWDEARFIEELKQKYIDKDETPLYRFLTYYFWDLCQTDIDEGFPKAVLLAYDGNLSKDQLITLIGKIHFLRESSISLPIDVDYEKIADGLEKRLTKIKNGEIVEPHSHTFIEGKDIDEEAKPLLEMLNRFDDRIVALENKAKYILYLSGDDSISEFSIKGICLEEFDDELFDIITQRYRDADNSEKREIILSLLDKTFDYQGHSTKENIQHTKDNLNRLIQFLQGLDFTDSISKLINRLLIDKISAKIDRLQDT